jgi:uncharacterized membrane protein YccC
VWSRATRPRRTLPQEFAAQHDTISGHMTAWATRLGLTRDALLHSVRTAVASVASLLLARALRLPEFYWAPVSTIVILLSPSDPFTLAWQRFAGTAVGAVVGALIATFTPVNWMVYGGMKYGWMVYAAGILVCGILSALLRLGGAYRFAAITLSIILLIAHTAPPWVVSYHRFVEVSLGIAVGLLLTKVWRLPSPK